MKQSTELIMRILILIGVIILNVAVYMNGIKLDEKNCQVKFTSEVFGEEKIIAMNITEMYDNFLEGKCLIKFDETFGYHEAFTPNS